MAIANITGNILTDSGVSTSSLVSGSGTTNYIPKFTASGTIGNSSIIDNGTITAYTNAFYVYQTAGTGAAFYMTGGGTDATISSVTSGGANQNLNLMGSTLSLWTGTLGGLAYTERMRITPTGNVGIGTSSPYAPFGGNARAMEIRSGDTTSIPSLFLRNSDASASLGFYINPSGTGTVGTSSNHALQLVTNDAERMRITSDGQVFVRTTAAFQGAETMCVLNNGSTSIFSKQEGGSGAWVQKMWNNATSGNNNFCEFLTESSLTARGSITYNRGVGLTVFNTTSDYRLKTEINDFNALDIINNLKPKEYRIGEAENKSIGFIAHELQEYLPQAVTGEKDAIDEDGNPIYQSVDYSQLTGLLTKAIQELSAKVLALENK
jgi:hypothetical protein